MSWRGSTRPRAGTREALQLLNAAHRLFSRLDARVDLVDVTSKTNRLEETYFAVVRDWGQSIESADSYTFGHCERVASYAVAVATALGADQGQLTTIRMGAYLHDVGKVKVPHQILNKPGRLTDDEFAVIKRHPVWGSSFSPRSSSPGTSSRSSATITSATTAPAIPTVSRATRSRSGPRSSASWTCTTR